MRTTSSAWWRAAIDFSCRPRRAPSASWIRGASSPAGISSLSHSYSHSSTTGEFPIVRQRNFAAAAVATLVQNSTDYPRWFYLIVYRDRSRLLLLVCYLPHTCQL